MKATVISVTLLLLLSWADAISLNLSRGEPDSHSLSDIKDIFSPVLDRSSNKLCRRHSGEYRRALLRGETWAVHMSESGSGPPTGQVMNLGSYRKCVSVEGVASKGGPFSGQHCMVTFGPPAWKTEVEFLARRGARYIHEKHLQEYPEQQEYLDPLLRWASTSFLWSVCIPSSCDTGDLQRHLRTTLLTALGGRLENLTVRVGALACSSRADHRRLYTRDAVMILMGLLLGALVIVGTAYDIFATTKGPRRDLLLAFSVRKNARTLVRPPKRANSLTGLDGIRVLSMLVISVFHRLSTTTHTPSLGPDMAESPWSQFVFRHGSLAVDNLLMLSGLLLTYNLLRAERQSGRVNLFSLYVRRYLRLTPVYGLLILLSMSHIGDFINEGPMWKTNMAANRERCEGSWMWSLAYLSNYLPLESQCMINAWSLAVDMQLFILSPLLLFPLARRPGLGTKLLGILFFAGVAVSIAVPYLHRFQVDLFYDYGEMGRLMYSPTHTRFTAWLIGVALGYVLHVTSDRSQRLSRLAATAGSLLSVFLMTASLLLADHFASPDYQYERIGSSLYLGLYRPCWVLGLAWLVFACNRGYAGRLNRVLEWPVFYTLAQLNYSVLLIHVVVMGNSFAILQEPEVTGSSHELHKYLRDMSITYVASLITYLAVELPVSNVAGFLLAKDANIGKSKQS